MTAGRRFVATCYRAHNPRWSFLPLSGDGPAVRGARFNPKGVPALYLALAITTAIKEINQGFAHKLDPCVLCAYDVDCDDIVDLRGDKDRANAGVSLADMACAWFSDLAQGRMPPSWEIARRFIAAGHAGVLVPSFAPGANPDDHNLVLWKWTRDRPHKVTVYDPGGRLPKDQLSWR